MAKIKVPSPMTKEEVKRLRAKSRAERGRCPTCHRLHPVPKVLTGEALERAKAKLAKLQALIGGGK